jgi:hypothetical protein
VDEVDTDDSRGQDDHHHSGHEGEQVAGHASAGNSSHGDSVIPVEPPRRQGEVNEVDTDDSRGQDDHHHHSGHEGEQVAGHASAGNCSLGDSAIPVEPPRRQGECDRQTTLLRYINVRLAYLAAFALYFRLVWWVMRAYLLR